MSIGDKVREVNDTHIGVIEFFNKLGDKAWVRYHKGYAKWVGIENLIKDDSDA